MLTSPSKSAQAQRKSTSGRHCQLSAWGTRCHELSHFAIISMYHNSGNTVAYPLIKSSRKSRPAKVIKLRARVQSSAKETRSSESADVPLDFVPTPLSSMER